MSPAASARIPHDRSQAAQVRRFRSWDNALCGVLLTTGGTLDLHEGEVSRNPIGANVQTVRFDIGRLEDRVEYVDNGRNLGSATLVLPEPPEGLDL